MIKGLKSQFPEILWKQVTEKKWREGVTLKGNCLKKPNNPDVLNYSTHCKLLSGHSRSVVSTDTTQTFHSRRQTWARYGMLRVGFFFFLPYRPLFKPHCFDIQQSQEVDWTQKVRRGRMNRLMFHWQKWQGTVHYFFHVPYNTNRKKNRKQKSFKSFHNNIQEQISYNTWLFR